MISRRLIFLLPALRTSVTVVLLFALTMYMALSPLVAWPLYSSLLFQPRHKAAPDEPWKQIERDFNVCRKDVFFSSEDGTKLHGVFIRLPHSKRVFFVSHGKGGTLHNRSGITRLLLSCDGSVFLYDYRGYGKSGGTPSLDGVCNDACAAFDYLVQKEGVDPKRVIVCGESFGSGVTGQLVVRRDVGAVIIQAGFSSLLRASRDVFPLLRLYPDCWFPPQTMDNTKVFARRHPPLLIVHGARDKFVVVKNAHDLFAAAVEPKELLILPNGDHGSFGKGNDYIYVLRRFLQKHNL